MRFTDVDHHHPGDRHRRRRSASVSAAAARASSPRASGLFSWTGLARLVRGEFLGLREREFVDAARVAGASNGRIIFKHILPNTIGVIIVNITLLMAPAILLETALSFLGFGIKPPDISLGPAHQRSTRRRSPPVRGCSGGRACSSSSIALCINFIGDGLRDAFDPRQKKFNAKRARDRGTRGPAGAAAVPVASATPNAAFRPAAADDGDPVPPAAVPDQAR